MLPGPRREYPNFRLVGFIALLGIVVAAVPLVTISRNGFADKASITVLTARSGLSVEAGTKVTLNGVAVGRVRSVRAETSGSQPAVRLELGVDAKYLELMPDDAVVRIAASTVFGGKQVAFSTKGATSPRPVRDGAEIDARSVTVEFNSLFETVVSVAEKVDPVKLNATLTATAQALDGLGDRFGAALDDGNTILADLNPRMPRLHDDLVTLAEISDVYADAAPDVFDGLELSTTTAHSLNAMRQNVDAALLAAIGFGDQGADIAERAGPYLSRGAADFLPTSALFDEYSPALHCTIRNYHDQQPKMAEAVGGNGYSSVTHTQLIGVGNPYVYPDNLPRVNAQGGPEGRPGCWATTTRELWPAPYLVMDTGASIAPYNHLELGQPFAIDYVWGRQIGENTINP
ncbi:MCE family protein [Mycobacterium sp. GA-2829]|uniref:MCE family protein n=1 Tax=Mycobacterium sp. GA-2829 TaxID=1772283 RepID=UPI000740009C|nr:MCE family protein [Mycobacterium sp. GA-2829]KUI26522.1 MCE-family protein MCE1A [Mycobacterium sp. GA-2829]